MPILLVFAASISIAWTTFAVPGSSVPVGSSANSMNGSFASCRASTTRCFSPPERSRAICIIRWESFTWSMRSAARLIALSCG